MSIIENIAPRMKGRPPKPREQEVTPLEAAMSETLPSQVRELVAELNLACKVVDKVRTAYRETEETARMTPEHTRKAARDAVEAAEQVVDISRKNRQEIKIDLNAARKRVEEAEGLGAKGVRYPGVQQMEDDRLSDARKNLAELLEEKDRNDARLAKDEERLANARRDEALLEKGPEAAAFEAWQRAIAKRDVAEQLGHSGDVPTVEEIEELSAAHEKAKLDAIAPVNLRLEAIREEYERALQVVRDLQQRLHDLLQPYTVKWRAAAEEQLSIAVKMISQTQQLKSLLAEDGDVLDAFSFPRFDAAGYHRADPRIAGDDSMRDVYLAMTASSREMSRSLS